MTVDLNKRNEITDLIGRVERLMAPDRSIDWAIYTRHGINGVGLYGNHPHYTGSMDAAMTLIPEQYMINQMSDIAFDGLQGVHLVAVGEPDAISFGTINLITAMCAASLRAEYHV